MRTSIVCDLLLMQLYWWAEGNGVQESESLGEEALDTGGMYETVDPDLPVRELDDDVELEWATYSTELILEV